MNTSRNNLIFALVMSLLFGGYFYYKFAHKSSDKDTETTSPTEAQQPEASTPAELKTQVEKINAYIKCIGRNAGRVRQSEERYYSWCAKTGPTGKESNIYGLYTIYGIGGYCDDSEKWAKTAPKMPKLEVAVKQYITMLNLLDNFLKQVDKYYSQGDYKDDEMAKGKAFHSELQVNFEQFYAAEKLLRQAIEEEKKNVKQLPALPIYPLYQAAQTLIDELHTQTEYSPTMLEKINTFDEKISNVKLENVKFAEENSWFFSAMDNLVRNSKEYVRHLRDDKKDKNVYPENQKAYQKMMRSQLLAEKNNLAVAYNGIRSEQPFLCELFQD